MMNELQYIVDEGIRAWEKEIEWDGKKINKVTRIVRGDRIDLDSIGVEIVAKSKESVAKRIVTDAQAKIAVKIEDVHVRALTDEENYANCGFHSPESLRKLVAIDTYFKFGSEGYSAFKSLMEDMINLESEDK